MSDINVNQEQLDKLQNDLNRENGQLSRFNALLDNAQFAQNKLQPMRRLQRRRFMKGLLRRAKNDVLTNDDKRIISGIGDSAEEFSNQSRRDVIKLGRDLVNGGLTNRLGGLIDEVNNSNNSITDFKNQIDKLKQEQATSIVEPKIEKEIKPDPVPKVDNTDLSSFKSFGEAFREARKNNLTEFKWKPTKANPSGRFSTELASSTQKTPQVTPKAANTSNTMPSSSATAGKNEANTSSSSSVTAGTGNNKVNYVERVEPRIKWGNWHNLQNTNSTAKSTSNTASSRSVGVGNINYGTANSTIGAEFVIPQNNYTRKAKTRKTSKGSPPPRGWSNAVTLPVDGSKLSLTPPQTDVWSRVGWQPIFRGTLDANGEFIQK